MTTEVKKEEKNKFPEVTNGMRIFLLSLLGLMALFAIAVAIIGGIPSEVVSINPVRDSVSTLFAVGFIILCLLGIVSIFKKSLRYRLIIPLAVLLFTFVILGCVNLFFERASYKVAKDKEPIERLCVITFHHHYHNESTKIVEKNGRDIETTTTIDHYNMDFRFLDDGHEESIALEYPFRYFKMFEKGDTCIAYVRTGLFGLQFVTDMKLKAKVSQTDEEADEEADEEVVEEAIEEE